MSILNNTLITRLAVVSLALGLGACGSAEDFASDGEVEDMVDVDGAVQEAEGALWTAQGSCVYDGISCFKYHVGFPNSSNPGCLTEMFLDVKKNGQSAWTNIKSASAADGANWHILASHIDDYTAYSIQDIRLRVRGSAGCNFSSWIDTSPRVRKTSLSGVTSIFAVSNLNYPNTYSPACNTTGSAILDTSLTPESAAGHNPIVDVPGVNLTVDRIGLDPKPGVGNPCTFQGGNDFVCFLIGANAPLVNGSRQATFAVYGFNL